MSSSRQLSHAEQKLISALRSSRSFNGKRADQPMTVVQGLPYLYNLFVRTFEELDIEAEKALPFRSIINPDDKLFFLRVI